MQGIRNPQSAVTENPHSEIRIPKSLPRPGAGLPAHAFRRFRPVPVILGTHRHRRQRMIRPVHRLALATVLAALAIPARADDPFFSGLGDLAGGGTYSDAWGISGDGS